MIDYLGNLPSWGVLIAMVGSYLLGVGTREWLIGTIARLRLVYARWYGSRNPK